MRIFSRTHRRPRIRTERSSKGGDHEEADRLLPLLCEPMVLARAHEDHVAWGKRRLPVDRFQNPATGLHDELVLPLVAVHRRRAALADDDLVKGARECAVLAADQRPDPRVHSADLVEPFHRRPAEFRLVQRMRRWAPPSKTFSPGGRQNRTLKCVRANPAVMFVGQFVDEGLGNAAHIFGSKESKVAAIVDPLRDVDGYLATAEHHGLEIRYVFDTRLHNDFVSGAREIAAKTGARVVAGADAGLAFDHTPLADGESLSMGDLKVTALATPGHTPEHMAYAVAADGPGGPSMVFTGGALIVGGVARTDLLGKENSVPFPKQLYHSLREKLMTLPDAVSVFPTHGAGSFCAAPATAERQTTIGRERVANPLVLARSEEDFVRRALEGLPSYPVYFGSLRPVNQKGPKILGGLPQPPAIPPAAVKVLAAGGPSILHFLPPPLFLRAHIPGAYGISAHAPLTTWAGWLIPVGTPLILVSHGPRDLESAVRQLIRIGFDDLRGTVGGGMAAW